MNNFSFVFFRLAAMHRTSCNLGERLEQQQQNEYKKKRKMYWVWGPRKQCINIIHDHNFRSVSVCIMMIDVNACARALELCHGSPVYCYCQVGYKTKTIELHSNINWAELKINMIHLSIECLLNRSHSISKRYFTSIHHNNCLLLSCTTKLVY